jgi:hypothetical protein
MPHRARDTGETKNEQAIRVSPNRLLIEDLTAFGYPRPAPLLAAGDHVFFEGRTGGRANRSVFHLSIFKPTDKAVSSTRHSGARLFGANPESRGVSYLWIPGSRGFAPRPGMTAIFFFSRETSPHEP